jgi:hypothetical protein
MSDARNDQSKAHDASAESLADAWKDDLALALLQTAERALARLKPPGLAPARIRPGRALRKDLEALSGDLIAIVELAKAFVALRDARPKSRRAGGRKDGRPPGKWQRWQSREHWAAFTIRAQYEAWRQEHGERHVSREEKEKINNDVIGGMNNVAIMQGKRRLKTELVLTLVRGPTSRLL